MKRYAIRYVEKKFNIDKMKNVQLKGYIQDAFFRTRKERTAFINKNSMYAYQYGRVIDGDIYSVVWDKYFIIKAGKLTRLASIQFGNHLFNIEVNLSGAFISLEAFCEGKGWVQRSLITELSEVLQEKKLKWVFEAAGDAWDFHIDWNVIETISEAVEVMCEV